MKLNKTKPKRYWKNKDNIKKVVSEILHRNNLHHDPLLAGHELTNKMINDVSRSVRYAIKPFSKYEFLKVHYGDEIKQWMIIRNTNNYIVDEELIFEVFDFVERYFAIEIKDCTKTDFNEMGLGYIFARGNLDIYEMIDRYYGIERHPWERDVVRDRLWDDKDIVRKAVVWLVEEKLKINPVEVPEKIRAYHFDEYGLSTLFSPNYGFTIKEVIKLAYPNFKFEDSAFRYPVSAALAGVAFENIVKEVLETLCGKNILYNVPLNNCRHKTKCRPDFRNIKLSGYFGTKDIVDAKLYVNTLQKSETIRYLNHCKNLVVIYLIGQKASEEKLKNVKFFNIFEITKYLSNYKKNKIEKELRSLMRGHFTGSIEKYGNVIDKLYVNSQCRLFDSGDCTIPANGDKHEVKSFGFCYYHSKLFRENKIDIEGNLLVDQLSKRKAIPKEHKNFIRENYQTMNNLEIGEALYGDKSRKNGQKVGTILRRMGLKRTKSEKANVRKEPIVYDQKTLKILKENADKKTLGEICKLLDIVNDQKNRGRIGEALSRYGYKTDSKVLRFREVCSIARENDGKCLEDKYNNNNFKMRFKCKNGHIFYKSRKLLIRDGWKCKFCNN